MELVAKAGLVVLRLTAARPLGQVGLAVEAEMVVEGLGAAVELEVMAETQLALNTRVETGEMAATAETGSEATEVVGPREERVCRLVAAAAREVEVFSRLDRRAWGVLVGWVEV